MDKIEHEIKILDTISRTELIKQRELSKTVGLSLGMTNAIIRRLIKKGLLQIKKMNNRRIQYLISPSGVKAIAQRSYSYFKRTVSNMVLYRKNILGIVDKCIQDGYKVISLIGDSDIDFIIEHSCYTEGLQFQRETSIGNKADTFYLITEQLDPSEDNLIVRKNVIYLRSIIIAV
jgi:DNA-binding MarR family transcriptional regulator